MGDDKGRDPDLEKRMASVRGAYGKQPGLYKQLKEIASKLGVKEEKEGTLTPTNVLPVISAAIDELLGKLADVESLSAQGGGTSGLDPDLERRKRAVRY